MRPAGRAGRRAGTHAVVELGGPVRPGGQVVDCIVSRVLGVQEQAHVLYVVFDGGFHTLCWERHHCKETARQPGAPWGLRSGPSVSRLPPPASRLLPSDAVLRCSRLPSAGAPQDLPTVHLAGRSCRDPTHSRASKRPISSLVPIWLGDPFPPVSTVRGLAHSSTAEPRKSSPGRSCCTVHCSPEAPFPATRPSRPGCSGLSGGPCPVPSPTGGQRSTRGESSRRTCDSGCDVGNVQVPLRVTGTQKNTWSGQGTSSEVTRT